MARPKNNIGRVQLITLGCSKNRVDSEHILKQVEYAGGEIAPEDEDLSAGMVDTVIINTCGFIKDAKIESINAILEAVEAKKRGLISKLFVFGCLSQRYGEDLAGEIPEADGFFGAFDAASVLSALGVEKRKSLEAQRYLTTPRHYAYLKISEGCDRTCSYCAIPLIRGKHKSVPMFPDDVIEAVATNPKICKYIDIPLQHVSTKVLKAMRRSIDGPGTKALIRSFRERIPGVVLRTTMMVGHPGEDSREFSKLMDFIGQAAFERLGAFTYSEEEGTYGAANFKDSVRESTKQKRYDELMEKQSGISLDYNISRIGKREFVIVDSFSDGVFVTRSQYESPEVDGEILAGMDTLPEDGVVVYERLYGERKSKLIPKKDIETDPGILAGSFILVEITGANEYDLIAKFI